MINTKAGWMTSMEAKMICDIDRELKNAVTLPIKKGANMGRTTHSTKVHNK